MLCRSILPALFGLLVAVGCTTGRSTRPPTATSDAGLAMRDAIVVLPGCDAVQDKDGDGIADSVEGDGDVDSDGTPNDRDTDSDGDGIGDRDEQHGREPCVFSDADGDGVADAYDTDSDNDGLFDEDEHATHRTDPYARDTDGDGVTDLGEVEGTRTDPRDPASTIASGDFFVVLPYGGEHDRRRLTFGTNIALADVYFLLDTTASMDVEVANVQRGLEDVIVPGVRALVPDVQFGAGGFDDFPIEPHGMAGDLPFYHLVDIGSPTADRGRWAMGGPFGAIGQLAIGMPNGVADLLEAVRRYPRHDGANGCESATEALYQVATGAGVEFDGGATPRKTCAAVGGEVPIGYPCFRPDALPIVVLVSDAPLHEPLPPTWPLDTAEDTCRYAEVPTAHTYDQAAAALRAIGARVVSLSTAPYPPIPGYPAMQHLCNVTEATGAVRADGTPLCFDIGQDGLDITNDVVAAIAELVGGTPQDVSTRTRNVPGNPDDFDATRFIKSIAPNEGFRDGVPGARAGISYTNKDETTFYGVIPGTQVEFSIDFHNDVRPPASRAQVFRARILVVGNGVAALESRQVFVIVPPDGGIVLI